MSDDSGAGTPSGSTDGGNAADGSTSQQAATTPRRSTPGASAASRARRIGGATTTTTTRRAIEPVEDVETAAPDTGRTRRWGRKPAAAQTSTSEPAGKPAAGKPAAGKPATGKQTGTANTGTAAAAGDAVSMRKRQPRTTSARDLKAEAETSSTAAAEVPGWVRWIPALVLSLCAVAMIVIIAVSAHGVWYAKPSTSSERDKVLAAAKRCTAVANTYNYKTLAADEKRGLACTTGAWTAQYRSALEKIVKPSATQLKASQTVQITAAGVESVTGNGRQWTTIVYGQLTINQSGATPRIDPFAAVVRMNKVKSNYLVSKIDLVTDPTA